MSPEPSIKSSHESQRSPPDQKFQPSKLANIASFLYLGCIFRFWLELGSSSSVDKKMHKASVAVQSAESTHDRKRLRKMPFTIKTFRYVMKRMSAHSWVARVISRADVPTFERAAAEMPFYSSDSVKGESERAISKFDNPTPM